ncbi:hypothetical protein Gohar_009085 [Gossypium harknessii]|uniref:Uncharacterized protein n=1 Tax=Gossypium harknessii TaxID=34285 RepID=A0A7J9GMB3_9ROSI|nr:hypothetical protein [Gossypium harknessii]
MPSWSPLLCRQTTTSNLMLPKPETNITTQLFVEMLRSIRDILVSSEKGGI